MKALFAKHGYLIGREATLGPRHEMDAFHRPLQRRDGLRVVRIQYDAVACAACPGCERLDWMQCRDARTTRLFTGRDRDLAPVFDFPVEPFALDIE